MPKRPALYPLKGKVQPYSWGGFEFLPALLGMEKTGKPFAEYWLGTHPAQPSEVVVGEQTQLLSHFIEEDPRLVLGEKVADRFGALPFLLKVLDVRQMLSIQVHPDKQAAAAAFEWENSQGIPIAAPHRNYRDAHHKPELMVALSDFWLLHGFKPADKLQALLETEPDLGFLLPVFHSGGYEALYNKVMDMPQQEVNSILQPMIGRLQPLYKNGELKKEEEDFWVARAAETFCTNGQVDRGIFSIYLFNLLHLEKGQGIYQPAGLPHAYLEGQNVEIMANSDNVLRAGLTDKHIDIPELMKHVRFVATEPVILKPEGNTTIYRTPAEEFELAAWKGVKGNRWDMQTDGPVILLVMEGAAIIIENGNNSTVEKGQALFVTAGHSFQMQLLTDALIFQASVP